MSDQKTSIPLPSTLKTFAISTVAMGSTEFVLDGGMAHGAVVAGNFNVINATSRFSISIPGIFGTGGTEVVANFVTNSNRFALYSIVYSIAGGTIAGAFIAGAVTGAASIDFINLTLGDDVGPALNFANSYSGKLPDNFDGYIGFRFSTNGEGDHYGWIRAVGNADGSQLSLTEYAYESTPEATIQIGQVPEPSSLALLALGAGGLASYRRRKAA